MRTVWRILPQEFRRRGIGVAASLLLRAALNLAGVAALLPPLTLLLDPAGPAKGPLARWYDTLGFGSERGFAAALCTAVMGVVVVKNLLALRLARIEHDYVYDLYRTLSRRLFVTYYERGLPFIQANDSAVLSRNIQVVCLAFTAGVLRPAAAVAAETMLLAMLAGALILYAPAAALLSAGVFLPATVLYLRLAHRRLHEYGLHENRALREKARLVSRTFRGYPDIEVNGAFPAILRRFDRAMEEVVRTRRSEAYMALLPRMLTETGLAAGLVLLAAWGSGRADAQLLFGIFAVAALRAMPSVRNILASWATIRYNGYTLAILRDAMPEKDKGNAPEKDAREASARDGAAVPRKLRRRTVSEEASGHSVPDADAAPETVTQRPGSVSCPVDEKWTGSGYAPERGADARTAAANAGGKQTAGDHASEPAPRTEPPSGTATGTEIPAEPTSGSRHQTGIGAKASVRESNAARVSSAEQTATVPEIEPAQAPLPGTLPFCREIAFRNVAFRYPTGGRDIFREFSLVIRKGERIGFRGPSGIGKTTLVHLLLGLYEPTAGRIEIDGTPLTPRNRRAWQNRIGYVSQRLFLWEGSLAANIAPGTAEADIDRRRVRQALEASQLGAFVDALPAGMDTPVGENGCRISGGQRQRIGIARAFYRRADVLVFDEATSELDSATEREITCAIARMAAERPGLTLILIAHRESTLGLCDRIITLGR